MNNTQSLITFAATHQNSITISVIQQNPTQLEMSLHLMEGLNRIVAVDCQNAVWTQFQ